MLWYHFSSFPEFVFTKVLSGFCVTSGHLPFLPCHNSGVFDGVDHCFLLEILPFLGCFDKSFPSLSVVMPSQYPVSDASPLSFKDVLQITILALHKLSLGNSNHSQDFNDHMNRLHIYLYFHSSKTSFDILTWLA